MGNDSFDDIARHVIQRLIDEKEKLYLTLNTAKMYISDNKIIEDVFGFFEKNMYHIGEIHIYDKNDRFGSHQSVCDKYVYFSLFKPFSTKTLI